MYWSTRAYLQEGLTWCRSALAKPPQDETTIEQIARARALSTCAGFEWGTGNYEQLLECAKKSLALASKVSDRKDIAIARFFVGAGLMAYKAENDQARSMYEQSIADFQQLNEIFWEALAFPYLGFLLARQGLAKHGDVVSKYLELARQSGERSILAAALSNNAYMLLITNRTSEALARAEESDRLLTQIGSKSYSYGSEVIALIAWESGDIEKAKTLYKKQEEIARVLGDKRLICFCLEDLGLLAMEEERLDQAQAYLEEAFVLWRETGHKALTARCQVELSNLYYALGNIEGFKQNFRDSLSSRESLEENYKTFILLTIIGSLYHPHPEISAQMLGVIDNCSKEDYFYFLPKEKRYCNRAEAYVRKTLGDAAYESEFAEGQKISLDEALDLALKTVEEM